MLQIAIDGPAGAGKSTIAKAVAEELGLLYIDTGAMYRALTFKVLQQGDEVTDQVKVIQTAQETEIVLEQGGSGKVWCDGNDVTEEIRQPEVSGKVSQIAIYPEVRNHMLVLQRKAAERHGLVMDGRDIGTQVLPEADIKIFLTALPEERARRRWLELKNAGKEISLAEVQNEIQQRDHQDSVRTVAPLKPASDAMIMDTTALGIEEIVKKIVSLAESEGTQAK